MASGIQAKLFWDCVRRATNWGGVVYRRTADSDQLRILVHGKKYMPAVMRRTRLLFLRVRVRFLLNQNWERLRPGSGINAGLTPKTQESENPI